jgi:tRNA threonylcarbamoyladenosine modification (KEOPS) complex  Pcc1 subunit
LKIESAHAVVEIHFPSKQEAETVFKSLLPEIMISKPRRSNVDSLLEGKVLILKVDAKDTTALRAVSNSYLRWIATISEINKVAGGKE